MLKKFKFPIRFKIMLTLLVIITLVVSIITFTMANLFHKDKTAYVHDLTSIMSTNLAEEADSLFEGYQEKLLVFSRLMAQRDMARKQKTMLVKRLFEDFHEFVGISFYWQGRELATVYDETSLAAAGLQKDDFVRFRENNPVSEEMVSGHKILVSNSSQNDLLPTMNLALSHPGPDGEGLMIIIATIRLDKLLAISSRSEAFQTFIVDESLNMIAHSDLDEVTSKEKMDWVPNLAELTGGRSVNATVEYEHNDQEIIGSFAPLHMGRLMVVVELPKSAAYLTARSLLRNLLAISLLLLVASALVSFLLSRVITAPIEKLSQAVTVVARGDFEVNVQVSSRDEIGDLAGSFNQMASELDERERALEEAQGALIQSEKMSAFGQLGAGIAHEVKNPLAGILGMAQLSLRKVDKESPLERNLLIIEKETKRCRTIIDNLMRFARQDKDKVELSQISLNKVVEDTLAIVAHQMSINQVKVEESLTDENTDVNGSANQVQQVLMNLMINAQQASGDNSGKIMVQTSCRAGNVEIEVADDGPGMPAQVAAQIFEPFFTTKPTGKGTGLGLSVSYGIIKDHAGELKVESIEGQGTSFTITIPVFRTAG
jgi:two-component system NtrC family sensor kinase